VDGFRIDSAAMLVKDPLLPDFDPDAPGGTPHPTPTGTASTRSTRSGAAWPTPTRSAKALIGEVWLPDPERFAMYLRPNEMHTAFNFSFLPVPGTRRSCAR
jgi:alpha-glucosidase